MSTFFLSCLDDKLASYPFRRVIQEGRLFIMKNIIGTAVFGFDSDWWAYCGP